MDEIDNDWEAFLQGNNEEVYVREKEYNENNLIIPKST